MVEAHQFDGMVMLPGCDKIVPGMLMAAMRLNIPAIVVPGGPMLPGKYKDMETITPYRYAGVDWQNSNRQADGG